MRYPGRFLLLCLGALFLTTTPVAAQYNYEQYPYYAVKKEATTPDYCTPVVMPNGELWFGSYNAGLFRWENGFLRPVAEPTQTPNSHRLITTDKFGNAWLQLADAWLGRVSESGVTYYKDRSGYWFYPLGSGVAVLNQRDSLWLPNPAGPWQYVCTVPKGAVIASNLSTERNLFYTIPDPDKKRLPQFFRRDASGQVTPLDMRAFSAYLTPQTVLMGVLDSGVFVLSETQKHTLMAVRNGKIIWEHQAAAGWAYYYTDGRHFWPLEKCTDRGAVRTYRIWDWQGERFVPYTFQLAGEGGDFGSIAKDVAGNFWFTTKSGLYRLFPSVISYPSDEHIPNNIVCVLEDGAGRTFMTSHGDKMAILDRGKAIAPPPLLRDISHWLMAAGRVNDQVWMPIADGVGYGIACVDRNLHSSTILPGTVFFYLKQNPDKSVAAGSSGKGLFYLPPGAEAWKAANWKIIDGSKGLKLTQIKALTQDTFGKIWCIGPGIAVYDPVQDTACTWGFQGSNQTADFEGNTIETDSRGNIWVGIDKKLRFFRPSKQNFRPDREWVTVLENVFNDTSITSIKLKGRDSLLIATERRLYVLDLAFFYNNGAEKNQAHSILGTLLNAGNSGLAGGAGFNGIYLSQGAGIYLTSDKSLQYLLPERLPTASEEQDLTIEKISFDGQSGGTNELSTSGIFPISRRMVRFTLRSWSNLNYYPDSIRLKVNDQVKKAVALSGNTLPEIDLHFDWPFIYKIEIEALRNGVVLASAHTTIINVGWAELFFLTIVLLVLSVPLFILKKHDLKAQLEKSDLEIASQQFQLMAFASQLEPHFLKNVLQTIQGRIFRIDPPLGDSIDDLSKMMQILVNSGKLKPPGIHTLQDEIALTQKYLLIQSRIFGDEKFTFELPDSALAWTWQALRLPVMSIQLFVENAFIHAIERMAKGGIIKIGLEDRESFIRISIDDNGAGMLESAATDRPKNANGTSRGIALMRSLFNIFNKHNAHNTHKLDFQLINKAELGLGSGVLVWVDIPKKFQFEPSI